LNDLGTSLKWRDGRGLAVKADCAHEVDSRVVGLAVTVVPRVEDLLGGEVHRRVLVLKEVRHRGVLAVPLKPVSERAVDGSNGH